MNPAETETQLNPSHESVSSNKDGGFIPWNGGTTGLGLGLGGMNMDDDMKQMQFTSVSSLLSSDSDTDALLWHIILWDSRCFQRTYVFVDWFVDFLVVIQNINDRTEADSHRRDLGTFQ